MKKRTVSYKFLERPADLSRGNVTSFVTDEMRQAILTLQLKPGDPIDRIAICDQLGVSRFPVSDAMTRLQFEGLVDILPQRGTLVSRVRLSEVAEYMFVRKALESEAVRTLVSSGAGAAIPHLRQAIAGQREAAARDDRFAFHEHDCAFHEHLLIALNYPRVSAIIDTARSNVDRARRLIQSPRRLAVTIAEHEAIVAGIEAGDGEAATAAMRRHIDAVMDELNHFVRDHPEHFADVE